MRTQRVEGWRQPMARSAAARHSPASVSSESVRSSNREVVTSRQREEHRLRTRCRPAIFNLARLPFELWRLPFPYCKELAVGSNDARSRAVWCGRLALPHPCRTLLSMTMP